MEITDEIIREDIVEFKEEIQALQAKLDALPGAAVTHSNRMKLKARGLGIEAGGMEYGLVLQQDIRHLGQG